MGGLLDVPIPDSHVPQTEGLQIAKRGHRLSTSCGFVERPDNNCGEDLVTYVFVRFSCLVPDPTLVFGNIFTVIVELLWNSLPSLTDF